MADSLLFDGSDDQITLAIGGAAFAFGPGTMMSIVKVVGSPVNYQAALVVGSSGSVRYGSFRNGAFDTATFVSDTNAPDTVDTLTAAQGWQLYGWTKATGTVAPRFHRYIFDSPGWTHSNLGTTVANSSVPATSAYIGNDPGGTSPWAGNILIAGVWNTVLSDGTIETLITGYQEWVDAAPREAWRLDTMSAIQSFGTVGTADESSRTGTTLDTGDVPAGWDDTLGGGGPTPPYVSVSVA